MKKFTVQTNCDLKNFTDESYPQGSFVLNLLLKKGDVRVNGERVKTNCKLKAGDEVAYYTTPAQESKPSHRLAYEDGNIYVADKLSGVSSEGLFYELKEVCPYPVHRLDRNTCGLIVIAKTKEAQAQLVQAFKQRKVQKTYLCFAADKFKKESEILCGYLKKDGGEKLVKVYKTPAADRVKIITEYTLLQRFGDYALVKVNLHTGKTHQIRAHLASIGCPVLGDGKYGDKTLNKKYNASRQILVAKRLIFSLEGKYEYLNFLNLESAFSPELYNLKN